MAINQTLEPISHPPPQSAALCVYFPVYVYEHSVCVVLSYIFLNHKSTATDTAESSFSSVHGEEGSH